MKLLPAIINDGTVPITVHLEITKEPVLGEAVLGIPFKSEVVTILPGMRKILAGITLISAVQCDSWIEDSLTVNFSATPTSGTVPLTVQFHDLSSGGLGVVTTWDWDWGDSTAHGTTKDPSHIYSTAGTYSPKLTVTTDESLTKSLTKPGLITANATTPPPVANFVGNPRSGPSPLTVNFSNTTTGGLAPFTYAWYLNNTVLSGTTRDISGTYTAVGTKDIRLVVTDAIGRTSSVTKTAYITVDGTGVMPVCNFTASPVSGTKPLTVNFVDASTGGPFTSYEWYFGDGGNGDGIGNATASHTYQNAGIYSVRHIVTNATGADSETKTNMINVSDGGSETFGCGSTYQGYAIGGGPGYPTFTTTTASHTVTNLADFLDYMTSWRALTLGGAVAHSGAHVATSGEVIFIPGTMTLDLTNIAQIVVPQGVTIASDRGKNSSLGALLKRPNGYEHEAGYTWADINTFKIAGSNVRITGLRLEGNMTPNSSDPIEPYGENQYTYGFAFYGAASPVIDNCEIRGWSQAGILYDAVTGTPKVNHCYIHSNQARGDGYGICTQNSTVNIIIEGCLFDNNRHSVCGEGTAGEMYEVRYCKHLGHGNHIGGHHFDIHQDGAGGHFAGKLYRIHHNTVLSSIEACVAIRCPPATGIYVDHNEFLQAPGSLEWGNYSVLYKIPGSYIDAGADWVRMYMTRNYLGKGATMALYDTSTGSTSSSAAVGYWYKFRNTG